MTRQRQSGPKGEVECGEGNGMLERNRWQMLYVYTDLLEYFYLQLAEFYEQSVCIWMANRFMKGEEVDWGQRKRANFAI